MFTLGEPLNLPLMVDVEELRLISRDYVLQKVLNPKAEKERLSDAQSTIGPSHGDRDPLQWRPPLLYSKMYDIMFENVRTISLWH